VALSGSELLEVRDLTAIPPGDVFRLVTMEVYKGGGVIRWVIHRPRPGTDAQVREAMIGCQISTDDGESFLLAGAGAFGGEHADTAARGEVAFTPGLPHDGLLVVDLGGVDRFEIPLS
jgi:hypothetical protein